MKKILKSSGYCCDGCQWFFCDFLRIEKIQVGMKRELNLFVPTYKYERFCDLFSGVEIIDKSLHICDQIYGRTYEGRV